MRARTRGGGCRIGGLIGVVLYAKYNSGKELHDSRGHLPRDASNLYMARTSLTDSVASESLTETGTITIGSSSVSGFSDANYLTGQVAPTGASPDYSVGVLFEFTGHGASNKKIVDRNNGTGGGIQILLDTGNGIDVNVYDASGTLVFGQTISSAGYSSGDFLWVFVCMGTDFGGTGTGSYMGICSDGARDTQIKTPTQHIPDHDAIDADVNIGRGSGTGEAYDGEVKRVLAWSQHLTETEMNDIGDGTSSLAPTLDYFGGSTYLSVDEGYEVGDAVGPPLPHNLLTATVTGTPDNGGRRAGFAFDDSNYIRFSPSATATSFSAVWVGNKPGTFKTLLASELVAGNDRVVFRTASGVEASLLASEGGSNDNLVASTGTSAGAACGAGWSYDQADGTKELRTYRVGALFSSDTENDATVNPDVSAESWWLGRNPTAGQHWGDSGGTADAVVFWESAETTTTLDSVYAALYASTDVNTVRVTYSATWASDGMVCGGYDPNKPGELFTLSGAGADPTVETS